MVAFKRVDRKPKQQKKCQLWDTDIEAYELGRQCVLRPSEYSGENSLSTKSLFQHWVHLGRVSIIWAFAFQVLTPSLFKGRTMGIGVRKGTSVAPKSSGEKILVLLLVSLWESRGFSFYLYDHEQVKLPFCFLIWKMKPKIFTPRASIRIEGNIYNIIQDQPVWSYLCPLYLNDQIIPHWNLRHPVGGSHIQ